MGEYAMFRETEIKIGTCEDMYYLRADQICRVRKTRAGHTDPSDPDVQKVIRFRFPWPDEDNVEPGAFESYGRSVGIYGVQPPADLEHSTVQFHAQAGYLVSLPCPESKDAGWLRVIKPDNTAATPVIHRNGFAGPVKIVQQAYRNGNLAVICKCGGCGALYNLPTLEEAQPVIAACRANANARQEEHSGFWHTVADRIEAGYR